MTITRAHTHDTHTHTQHDNLICHRYTDGAIVRGLYYDAPGSEQPTITDCLNPDSPFNQGPERYVGLDALPGRLAVFVGEHQNPDDPDVIAASELTGADVSSSLRAKYLNDNNIDYLECKRELRFSSPCLPVSSMGVLTGTNINPNRFQIKGNKGKLCVRTHKVWRKPPERAVMVRSPFGKHTHSDMLQVIDVKSSDFW